MIKAYVASSKLEAEKEVGRLCRELWDVGEEIKTLKQQRDALFSERNEFKKENYRLKKALHLRASRAGIADLREACRTIINTVKDALNREDK